MWWRPKILKRRVVRSRPIAGVLAATRHLLLVPMMIAFFSCAPRLARVASGKVMAASPATQVVSAVPSAPTFGGIFPASPNRLSTSPTISGSSSADTVLLNFYQDSVCSQLIGTGTKAAFEGTGVTVTAQNNASTSIYGRAFDGAARGSVCTLLTRYVHDTDAPVAVSTVSHASGNPSLSQSPAVSWSGGATDSLSGFGHYEVSIGTSAGDRSIQDWVSNGNSSSVTLSGLSLLSGVSYFFNVRVVDLAGNISPVTSSATPWLATGPAAKMVFSTALSLTGTAGTPFVRQPVVTIQDVGGTPVGTSTAQVTLTPYTDSACTAASSGTFTAGANPVTAAGGLATFAGITHTKAGVLYLLATSPGLISVCASSTTVFPSAPARLGFTSALNNPTAGLAFPTQPSVAVQDTYGNLVSAATDTITLSMSTGNCAADWPIPASHTFSVSVNPQMATAGIASFSGVKYTQIGYFTLRARSSSGYIDGCTAGFSIVPSPAVKLGFTLARTLPYATCSQLVGVNFQDQYGNDSAISGAARTINLAGSGSGAFYSDAACSTPVTSVVIAGGTFSGAFYFKDSVEQLLSLTGTDTAASPLTPAALSLKISHVNKLSATDRVGCALIDGQAWCWGYSGTGMLANGGNSPNLVPIVGLESNVTDISVGSNSVCAIQAGALYCWGQNTVGQVGNGSTGLGYASPQAVSGLSSGVTAVSVGSSYACAIKTGSAWCWGANGQGVLGNGTQTASNVPVQVSGWTSGVDAISAGTIHTCGIKSGVAYCWGNAGDGRLGDNLAGSHLVPSQVSVLGSAVTAISAGWNHTCALEGGAAFCWGLNAHGELGDNSKVSRAVPTPVSGLGSGVTAISTARGSTGFSSHSCAVVSGALKCWGANSMGELGVNSTADDLTPVQVSGLTSGVTEMVTVSDATCAVYNQLLSCWGKNGYEKFVHNSTLAPVYRLTPGVADNPNSNTTSISLGAYHSCSIQNGAAYCWGYNIYGMVGDGTNEYRMIPTAVTGLSTGVTQIAAGANHTCAIQSGAAFCWGYSGYGVLGDNSGLNRSTPSPVSGLGANVTQISAGQSGTCAIQNGGVFCWGQNNFGQMGDNNPADHLSPVSISSLASGVTSVSIGYTTACAVAAGKVYCWGSNANAMLGSTANLAASSAIPVQVMGLPSGVSDIAVGDTHACARVSGNVWCWGNGLQGKLGNGITTAGPFDPSQVAGLSSPVSAIAVSQPGAGTSGATCAVLSVGSLYCWGYNGEGNLGINTNTSVSTPTQVTGLNAGVTAVSMGMYHTAAVVANATQTWGYNRMGGLGSIVLNSVALVPLPINSW